MGYKKRNLLSRFKYVQYHTTVNVTSHIFVKLRFMIVYSDVDIIK